MIKKAFIGSIALSLASFLHAAIPPIETVEPLINAPNSDCRDLIPDRKDSPSADASKDRLTIADAFREGDRISALVYADVEGPFYVVEVNPKQPDLCKLTYTVSQEGEAFSDAIKDRYDAMLHNDAPGYLSGTNLRIVGRWNSGAKKFLGRNSAADEFLVLEWYHGHENQGLKTLEFINDGKVAQSVESGYLILDGEEDDSHSFSCHPDLGTTGIVVLNCDNVVSEKPPLKSKTYCWENGSLNECKGK